MAALPNGLEDLDTGVIAWRSILNNNLALLDASRFTSGVLGSRPAAANAGRYYYSTDAQVLSRDTGTAWQPVASNRIRAITGADTATGDDRTILVNATSGALAPVLPLSNATNKGMILTYVKTDSSGNGVTVTRQGSDTINGATTIAAITTQYGKVSVQADGAGAWYVVG